MDFPLPEHLPGLLAQMDDFIETQIKPLEREDIQYFDRRCLQSSPRALSGLDQRRSRTTGLPCWDNGIQLYRSHGLGSIQAFHI